ncbi:helix-turn-helix domain-containing protein [Streptomyces mangrovisoli]|uniref:PucR family transcriptional regulator n=1 Tax=Streptomyces mangrovisoli TaxID=1428628 RepID=A0A1J4NV34_9ACTN|nr:helix-turn-helix domain-containing protein [Streptomyces mangrovisoli]OIJ65380.1 PucR family transcriptional regulator [Streptomyces mangrovisoli]
MHVEHLLRDESLGLRLLWGEDTLLRRETSGVTVTDLADPARFVRRDEVVLSGLVWWSAGRAEPFVSALKDAGAAALLAGEETHGSVPDDLVEACERHGVPVAAVPAHVMFRAITDTVYLRHWGELSRHQALPEHVRARLDRLVAEDADPAAVLATVFAHLDRAPAYVLTPAGRTVAATPGAAPIPARDAVTGGGSGLTVAVETGVATAYDRWSLALPDATTAPPRLLHEVAAVLGRCQETLSRRRRAAGRRAADGLGRSLAAREDGRSVADAMRGCGAPTQGPYRVIVAATATATVVTTGAAAGSASAVAGETADKGESGTSTSIRHMARTGPDLAESALAESALAEAIAHATAASTPAAAFAVLGRLPDGSAFAVVPEEVAKSLVQAWPSVAACAPDVLLHGGLAAPAADPGALPGALAEARYALNSARATSPRASALADATTFTTLDTLISGIPQDVRAAYSRTVLGPLLEPGDASAAALLHTLEAFLAHDGSWSRTADALHLHVNTVHYRIQRIEHFTGRDLSRLTDRLDLRAALSCRPDPPQPVPTTARRARSSTSRAR